MCAQVTHKARGKGALLSGQNPCNFLTTPMNHLSANESNPTDPKVGGFDAAALEKFIEVGTKAWADVPDAAAWVRELRGWENVYAWNMEVFGTPPPSPVASRHPLPVGGRPFTEHIAA
jgi:hypothetical protein